MEIYIDTNILISMMKPNDISYKDAKCILNQKDLTFITGFITIIEFQSVIHNLWVQNELEIDDELRENIKDLSHYQQILTITELFLAQFSVEIISVSGSEIITIRKFLLFYSLPILSFMDKNSSALA